MTRFRGGFERMLEVTVLILMTALALIVVLGVGFRKAGAALVWYDEIASIVLAWLTYYGSCLAALKRTHIGFPKIVDSLPLRVRRGVVLIGEVIVLAFFALTAWAGWQVLLILEGDVLASLPWMPLRVTQSVIPIGAVLFIVAEVLSIPRALAEPGPAEGEGFDA